MSRLVLLRSWNKGKFTLWWDQENHIVRSHCRGKFDMEDAHFFSKSLIGLHDKIGPYRIFCDHREISRITLKAKRIYIKMFRDMRFAKIAVLNKSSLISRISMAVFKAVGFKQFKYFDSEEKAIKWLKDYDHSIDSE